MKKLLLISTFLVFIFACKNTSQIDKSTDQTEESIETTEEKLVTEPQIKDSIEVAEIQVEESTTNNKDENKIIIEAPKHNSPDQPILDSIKKYKRSLKE